MGGLSPHLRARSFRGFDGVAPKHMASRGVLTAVQAAVIARTCSRRWMGITGNTWLMAQLSIAERNTATPTQPHKSSRAQSMRASLISNE